MRTARSQAPGSPWLLAAICLAASLGYLNGVALNPFLATIAAELGVSVAALGQIPAIATAVGSGLGLAVGPLADHYGYRQMMVVGALALAVGSLGTALAPSYAALLVATVVGSMSLAAILPTALALLGAHFSGERRRRAISLVLGATNGAIIVGTPVLTTLATWLGWRAAFVVLGGGALLIAWVERRALPPDSTDRSSVVPLTDVRLADVRALFGPLGDSPTRGLVLSSHLRGVCAALFWTYFGAYLVEKRGLGLTDVGLAYTATASGLVLGSLLVGGRLGQVTLWPLVAGAMLLATLLLAGSLLLALSVVGLVATATLGYLAIAVVNTAATTLLAAGKSTGRATALTIYQSSNNAGWAIGSSLGGLLISLGSYPALGYGVSVFGATAALSAWVFRSLPSPARSLPDSRPIETGGPA